VGENTVASNFSIVEEVIGAVENDCAVIGYVASDRSFSTAIP